MSILNFIKNKEKEEYKNIRSLIRKRMSQIKEVQLMREANKDLIKLKPSKVILPCMLCGEGKMFFKDEALKICKACWKLVT